MKVMMMMKVEENGLINYDYQYQDKCEYNGWSEDCYCYNDKSDNNLLAEILSIVDTVNMDYNDNMYIIERHSQQQQQQRR